VGDRVLRTSDAEGAGIEVQRASDSLARIREDIKSLLEENARLRDALQIKDDQCKEAIKHLLIDMLEVQDDFDVRFANIEPREEGADRQTRIWLGYFRSVRRLLERKLAAEGVARIEAPAGKAIPGFHTIVEVERNLDLDDDTILEERRKGYLWRGEVLRTAEVKAVKN
jgi:molecular chaperone GrpE